MVMYAEMASWLFSVCEMRVSPWPGLGRRVSDWLIMMCGWERCLDTQGMERKWSISICSVLGVVEKDFAFDGDLEEEVIVAVDSV